MHTSQEAVSQLQQALATTRGAVNTIDNLIAEHDYQDVASLVAQAAASLLESTVLLMQSRDEAAIDALENAEDLLEAVYSIIDAELDEDA